MARFGLCERAKKSAHCPFHEDKHESFSVWYNGHWNWKCHAGCGHGDEITFLEVHEKLSHKDAVKRFLDLAGVNGFGKKNSVQRRADAQAPTPAEITTGNGDETSRKNRSWVFDWNECVAAFTK